MHAVGAVLNNLSVQSNPGLSFLVQVSTACQKWSLTTHRIRDNFILFQPIKCTSKKIGFGCIAIAKLALTNSPFHWFVIQNYLNKNQLFLIHQSTLDDSIDCLCDYFGFGLRHSIENPSKCNLMKLTMRTASILSSWSAFVCINTMDLTCSQNQHLLHCRLNAFSAISLWALSFLLLAF